MINCRTAPAVQPKKLKLPKKKAQTITEKATAPFANDDSTTPSILEYFENSDTEKNLNPITEERVSEVPSSKVTGRKPRMKDVIKSSKAKTQKGSQKPAILNSPETAIKYTEHQDLVFGTSSQLMRDESPTLIKDIQEALKASESMTLNSNKFSSDTPFNLFERSAVSSYTASKNLWSVAARDLDGSLLDTEVVNLVDTPMPPKFAAPEKVISRESESMQLEKESIDDINISDGSSHHFQRPQIHGRNRSAQETNPIPEQSIPRSVAEASLKDRRISRSPAKKRKAPKDSSAVISTLQDQMPNYARFTTAELSKTITTFGFKAIKKRNEMIALLERCWESQSRIVLQTLPTNVTLPLPLAKERSSREPSKSTSPAKKPRRPSKPISIQAVEPDLVATHEPDDTTTTPKPRGRPRKKLVPTTSEAAHPPHLIVPNPSPSPSLPSPHSIHASIHKAITTYPPTHSPTQPSFHERMLLYEPIVIEDLTTWLNTEGLGTVGVDEEVSSTLVKEWCMDMGVCCFWRADGRRR